jgi:hypothetical protein
MERHGVKIARGCGLRKQHRLFVLAEKKEKSFAGGWLQQQPPRSVLPPPPFPAPQQNAALQTE